MVIKEREGREAVKVPLWVKDVRQWRSSEAGEHGEAMPSVLKGSEGGNSHNHEDNSHQTGPDSSPESGNESKAARCEGGHWFQERCSHGNWRWIWVACDKWSCDACRKRRVETELVPEIMEALKEAHDRHVTLKHLVLTWQGDDVGAQPNRAGAKRRALDLAHLAQYLRRDRKSFFDYLKVAETHKSGTVHFHVLAIMPYVKQSELSKRWKRFTRGACVVNITACGIRCGRPGCWPGSKASQKRKRESMVIPWPDTGKCGRCGWKPSGGNAAQDTAWAVAKEAANYIGKDGGDDGIVKKLTRSGRTTRHCLGCDLKLVHFASGSWWCPDCDWRVTVPVEQVTGWQEIRRRSLAPPTMDIRRDERVNRYRCIRTYGRFRRGDGSYCEVCKDEHGYIFVGSAERMAEEYPGFQDSPGDGRSIAYHPADGRPCECWQGYGGDTVEFRRSGQAGASMGIQDMAQARDGPNPAPSGEGSRHRRDDAIWARYTIIRDARLAREGC